MGTFLLTSGGKHFYTERGKDIYVGCCGGKDDVDDEEEVEDVKEASQLYTGPRNFRGS